MRLRRAREAGPRRSHGSAPARTRWLAAAAALLLMAWPGRARAVEYEVYIDIDDEEDLNELQLTDQISDTTYETLVELLRRGTDLNRASREDLYALPNLSYEEVDRILAYRADAGRIADPADLVVAGVLSARKLASIAAFLEVPDLDGGKRSVHGRVRYQMTYVPGDPRVPPMALQARIRALGNLTVGGAAVLEPQQLGDIRWDPNRQALVASRDGAAVRVPKLYGMWDTERWAIIAGTYRIGFGQGLTLDNTRRYTPNGFQLDDAVYTRYDLSLICKESAGELRLSPCDDEERRGAPGFRFSQGMRGVAVGAKELPLPEGWLQAYGFWSMQGHDLYQYRLYDADRCEDPRSTDVECSAPALYAVGNDPLAPAAQYKYRTIPNAFDMFTQGANVAWYDDQRTHVGITGFGSIPRWREEGANLDFQPSHQFPRGGAFGAVGADFSWGHRWADLFGEVSRSFDQVPTEQGGGGGFAGIVRHTASWDEHEIEVSARYYDPKYANPYSSPISAQDRFEGNQARNEAGGRIRYTSRLANRVNLRSFADVWVVPTSNTPRTRLFARADVDVTKWWRPGLWLEYRNNDLARPGFLDCVDETDPDAQLRCGGQRVQITARSRFQPIKRFYFTVQYRHEFQNALYTDTETSRSFTDSGDIDLETFVPPTVGELLELEESNRLRQDVNAFIMLVAKPTDALRLRSRVRWFWEDIADNAHLEHSVWAYFDVQYKIRPWMMPTLRYDLYSYIDSRESTATRTPNPEHWIRLQIESRF